jgi:hypothetical protein
MRYAFEVVPLITERAYNCEYLLIIGLVVLFSIDELLRLECNRMPFRVAITNLLKL